MTIKLKSLIYNMIQSLHITKKINNCTRDMTENVEKKIFFLSNI